MLAVLRTAGVFHGDPFALLDIGCSGGIHPAFREFGNNLIAHGIDPVRDECERLQRAETLAGVKYHATFVGLPPTHEFMQRKARNSNGPNLNPWYRLSTGYALTLSLPKTVNRNTVSRDNLASEDSRIGVSEFVEREGLRNVDFLKIDVDGPDFEVLISASDMLDKRNVLAVVIESNYFGSDNDTDHTFHNTDRFLRKNGFNLCGLTVRPYSHKDLPMPFAYGALGQTIQGPPLQGDAIYMRDLAADYRWEYANRLPTTKLAKLAAIYEIFQLPDCAAELINVFRDRFSRLLRDPEDLLNALTPPLRGRKVTYREYIATFESNITQFIPY